MFEAAELLLISSVKLIDGLSRFLNSKQALNDGNTSSREALELSIGRKRSLAFWILAIIVAASFWIWRLGRYRHKQGTEIDSTLTYSRIKTPFVPGIVIFFINSPKGVESALFQRKKVNANVPKRTRIRTRPR